MQFEFGALQLYVSNHLPVPATDGPPPSPHELRLHENAIAQIIAVTKQALLDDLLLIDNAKQLRKFIHAHAYALGQLNVQLGRLYRKAARSRQPDSRQRLLQFYLEIDRQFSRLHDLLRENAPGRFDYAIAVPFSRKGPYQRKFAALLPAIEQLRSRLDQNNAPVLDVVLAPVTRFLLPYSAMSYHLAQYFSQLLPALSRIGTGNGQDVNFLLHLQLISLNFNEPAYIQHCYLKLVEKFDHKPAAEKLDALLWYDTRLNQITTQPDLALYRHRDDVRTQLKNWVKAEIIALQQLLTPELTNNTIPMKLHTNLTVAQLTMIIDTWMEMGLIPYVSKIAVWRAVAASLTTKGTDQPSVNSLIAKSNNPGKDTASGVIELFLKTVQQLRKKL